MFLTNTSYHGNSVHTALFSPNKALIIIIIIISPFYIFLTYYSIHYYIYNIAL